MTTDHPAAALLAAYQAAVYTKDVDAFAALYDDDVRIFDTWGRWSHDGLAAWRAMAVDWFASLGTERVRVDIDALQCDGGADWAVGHAFLRFTAVSEQGEVLRSLDNRITLVLRQRGGRWKVVHEHGSSPADFTTQKVMLQRQG